MIGRDTFWIPPHTLMYTAIALSGLLVAAVVLAGIVAAPRPGTYTTVLGLRAPLGLLILGLGVIQMILSAPFDDWWHRMYGVDVSVWSPPHLVGFSGAVVMLSGLIIAVLAERRRTAGASRAIFWMTALLFALVVRWITFLNSTSFMLSWAEEVDPYAIAPPWAGWWALWTSFAMTWTFVASACCWDARRPWRLPLAVLLLALVLRVLEFVVSSVGFALVLPWGDQVLSWPYVFFISDFGLWVITLPLVLPALGLALLSRWGRTWGAARFGLVAGLLWGLLVAIQFIAFRTLAGFALLSAGHAQALAISLAAGIAGGLIGARQGNWLARVTR
jgi:hypothetical protein